MKQTITNDRALLIQAVKQAAEVVASTMGPSPNCVTIALPGGGVTINDGVQVLRSLTPVNQKGERLMMDRDPMIDLAYDRMIRAAESTLRQAGDGTSSTAVLFAALLENAEQYLKDNPEVRRSDLAKEIEDDALKAVEMIKEIARPGESQDVLRAVANIAMHGHAWSEPIADLLWDLGVEGTFTVEVAKDGDGFSTEKVDGFTWAAGTIPECFNVRGKFEAKDGAFVAVIASEVSDLRDVEGVLECQQRCQEPGAHPSTWVPLVIVCPAVNGNAKVSLINAMVPYGNGYVRAPIVLLNVPKTGDMYDQLRDIAAATGGALFDRATYLDPSKHVPADHLGSAMKVIATEKSSLIVPGLNNRVNERIEDLELLKSELKGEELEAVSQRLSRLRGKYGVIKVPITTESEFGYLREMVEDCYRAVQSAMEHGVVPGGGWTLAWVATSMATEHGRSVVTDSLLAPRNALKAQYGGADVTDMFELSDPWDMADLTSKNSRDALKSGIIDNAGSVKAAVMNAAKEAAALIRTEYFFINDQRVR